MANNDCLIRDPAVNFEPYVAKAETSNGLPGSSTLVNDAQNTQRIGLGLYKLDIIVTNKGTLAATGSLSVYRTALAPGVNEPSPTLVSTTSVSSLAPNGTVKISVASFPNQYIFITNSCGQPVQADYYYLVNEECSGGGGGGVWGTITGTLSNQTDLQAALDSKLGVAGAIDITTLPVKTALHVNDKYLITDSEASNAPKATSYGNLQNLLLAFLPGNGLSSTALGYRITPITTISADYTIVAADSGGTILHPSSDTTARTVTIPANASVAFPAGTAITFVNQNGAGVLTIAINTDTMRLAGAGTTGSRTLAANGMATAVKITATEWIINGTGLT